MLAFTLTERVRARHRHARSLIAFTWSRTFGKPSSGSWAVWKRRSGTQRWPPRIIRRCQSNLRSRSRRGFGGRGASPDSAAPAGTRCARRCLIGSEPSTMPVGRSGRLPGLRLGRRRGTLGASIALPERNVMALKPCTPDTMGHSWRAVGLQATTKVRHLFTDIRHCGYTGSYSHLARFLAPWRSSAPTIDGVVEHGPRSAHHRRGMVLDAARWRSPAGMPFTHDGEADNEAGG